MTRPRHAKRTPAAIVVLKGLAVAAIAFALVFGALALFGGTDDGAQRALAPAVAAGASETSPSATSTTVAGATTATAPGATATDPAPPGSTGATSSTVAPTAAAATAGGTAAPAAGGSEPPAAPPPPTPTAPPAPTGHISVAAAGGDRISVTMGGFAPGQSLHVTCLLLGWEAKDSFTTTANAGGNASGSCNVGTPSGTHAYAVVNTDGLSVLRTCIAPEFCSNHVDW